MLFQKTTLALFIISSVGINAFAQSNHSIELAEAKRAISASNATYFIDIAKNDGSILNHYAEDANIFAPNAPAISGKEGMGHFFKHAYEVYGLKGGKFITKQVYGDGVNYVTEEGLWQSFDAKGKLFDDGKFLVLWKKTAKGWKMYRDSFSSNHEQKH